MNKSKLVIMLAVLFLGLTMQGCLSVETKEYTFKLKKDKSGQGVIKFINIMSDRKDSTTTLENDYKELVDSYLNGDKLKEEIPGTKNIKKRLFEEDGQLCGELSFEFDDITSLRFYKYKETGPWCYYLGYTPFGVMGGSETYFSSNGDFAGEHMPLVFWEGDQKEFKLKTSLNQPSGTTTSLLGTWKENNK
jgi:hypothetical protein